MYHSITIGDKNTWEDWHLIPSSRPLVAPPEVKTSYVEIPGGNGSIDLTETLSGRPTFQNRSGSWEFVCDNDFLPWHILYSEIMNYLHGRKFRCYLEDDPEYYYEGRFSVSQWSSAQKYSVIVINYNVAPYKKDIHASGDEWLWDTFNFETGIIRYYKNLPVSGTLTVDVIGSAMETVPTIIVNGEVTSVRFKSFDYELTTGINVISEIVLESGENSLTFTGNGSISVLFEGGSL